MSSDAEMNPAAASGVAVGSTSRPNPFRRNKPMGESASAAPTKSLEYEINGRHVTVSSGQYACYEKIWREQVPGIEAASAYIAEDAAADVIHHSDLTDDDLAELWDTALAANLPKVAFRAECRVGFLEQAEFFVLLSELQASLDMAVEVFYARFGLGTSLSLGNGGNAQPAIERNNLSTHDARSEAPMEPSQSLKAQIDDPEKEVVTHKPDLRAYVGVTEGHLLLQPTRDDADGIHGVKESLKDFRIHATDPEPISGVRNAHGTETDETTRSNTVLDAKLPAPSVPIESEKIVYCQAAIPHATEQNTSTVTQYPSLITTTTEAEGLIPLSTHFSNGKEVLSSTTKLGGRAPQLMGNGSTHSDGPSSLPTDNYSVSHTGDHELEARLSTKESDALAIKRVEALRQTEEQKQKSMRSKRTSIMSIGKSLKNAFVKDVEMTASGYSLNVLARALETAASEGNIPLIASLLSLGASAAYSRAKYHREHYALAKAAERGHAQVINLLIPRGSTKRQIDTALLKACYYDHADLAITLLEKWRANAYNCSLLPDVKQGAFMFSESCFHGIAFHVTGDQTRMKLLECFMRQGNFKVDKIIARACPVGGKKCRDLTALALFVNCGWIEGVQRLLAAGAALHVPSKTAFLLSDSSTQLTNILAEHFANDEDKYDSSLPAICCLSVRNWTQAPRRTLALCRELIRAGSALDVTHDWTSDCTTTCPLVTAIAGGSIKGTALLLASGANPEAKGSYTGKEYSALGLATRLGRLDIVRLLVDAGALAWKIAHGERPALFIACEEGWLELAEYLLEVGGQLSDEDGEECLAAAAYNMRLAVVELLMLNGVRESGHALRDMMMVPPAVQRLPAFLTVVDRLLESCPQIHSSVIHEAIIANNLAGLARILSSGKGDFTRTKSVIYPVSAADMPSTLRSGMQLSCLAFARYHEKKDFVRLLQSHGFQDGQRAAD